MYIYETQEIISDVKIKLMEIGTIEENKWKKIFRYVKHTDQVMFKTRFPESGLTYRRQGAVAIRKTVLPGMAIPMLKIRRPNGRLIFNMEITIRR